MSKLSPRKNVATFFDNPYSDTNPPVKELDQITVPSSKDLREKNRKSDIFNRYLHKCVSVVAWLSLARITNHYVCLTGKKLCFCWHAIVCLNEGLGYGLGFWLEYGLGLVAM